MNNTNPVHLSAKQLCFHYPGASWELSVDDYSISSGELKAIIGPNGSGKSTFLKLVAGILPMSQGELRLNHTPIHKMKRKEIAKFIGYLPQYIIVDLNYRVHELIEMGRYPHLKGSNYLDAHDYHVVQHCMEITGTIDLANRRVFQLSGGERQRVFLASVLAQEPSIMLFDEPTNALDVHHQVEFIHILRDLNKKGIAVVLVTHDINLASSVCDSILLLHQGKKIKEGKPEDVLTESILEQVYGGELYFTKHPLIKRPWILPKFSSI